MLLGTKRSKQEQISRPEVGRAHVTRQGATLSILHKVELRCYTIFAPNESPSCATWHTCEPLNRWQDAHDALQTNRTNERDTEKSTSLGKAGSSQLPCRLTPPHPGAQSNNCKSERSTLLGRTRSCVQ